MTTAFTDGVIGAIRLGSVVGLCICGFLLFRQMSGSLETLGGCNGDWSCAEVFNSKWGTLFGIPVALIAVVSYLTIFVLSLAPVRKMGRYSDVILGALGIALLIGSLWFVGVQLTFGVKCTFCLLAQFVGVSVGGIILKSLCEAIRFGVKVSAVPTFLLSFFLALAFIGGQYGGSGDDLSVGKEGVTADGDQRFENGFHKFPNLGLSIERGKFPTIGNPKADKAVVVLLDYSTISSQRIHPHITALAETLGEKLAIILIPVPLDKDCNQYWESAHSADACQMATYAYAAWEANPRIYKTYHDFLMQGGTHSESGSISGTVWQDIDSNGIMDPGEKGLGGVKVNLIRSINVAAPIRKTTDDTGRFVFGNLPAGMVDMRYQLQVPDSNFADGAVLAGMINTFSGSEERNSSLYFELSNSRATLTDKNFGFVESSRYKESTILSEDSSTTDGSDDEEIDPLIAELFRQAGEESETISRLLPDFEKLESEEGGAGTGSVWADEDNPVLELLQAGTTIYGDLRHLSPALPKVIFGSDMVRNGVIDESPKVFVRKVREASDLISRR